MKQNDLPLYKFYLTEDMTQENLNKLALERNNLAEEVYRLNNIIEKLKELVIALWHDNDTIFLNKEQIDLLNNIVFGNDEEDLGSDKE